MINKSRHLEPYTYFEIIQREYIICELRSKIFPRRNKNRHVFRDCEYFKNVMKGKKEKIIDFGNRNRMPTIFDSDKIKQQIVEQVIPERGTPNFIYKDDEEKVRLEPLDKRFYFSTSSSVKVFTGKSNKEFDVGSISQYDNEADILKVRIRNSTEVRVVSPNNICRIL